MGIFNFFKRPRSWKDVKSDGTHTIRDSNNEFITEKFTLKNGKLNGVKYNYFSHYNWHLDGQPGVEEETNWDNSSVVIEELASGPLELDNLTCFSIMIFFEFCCFFNMVKITGAVIPNV